MELIDVVCPRCQREVSQRFYGPCDACRSELKTSMGGEQHALTSTDYEPKMNVTPNAVATKD